MPSPVTMIVSTVKHLQHLILVNERKLQNN